MKKEGNIAAHKNHPLTKHYGKIGIPAVAAASRYQRSDSGEKSRPSRPQENSNNEGSFRGTPAKR